MKEELQNLLDRLEQRYVERFEAVAKDSTKSHDELKTELTDTLTELRAKLEEQDQRLNTLVSKGSLPGVESEAQNFSFHKAARGIFTGKWEDAGLEKEVYDNMHKRGQSAGDGSEGGYLVPTEMASFIVEPALAAMPMYGLGITTIDNVRGTFEIPVLETRPDGGHTTENGELTAIDYAFGQKLMVPKRGGGYCKVSKRLINQTGGTAEAFIRRQLQKSMSVTIHKALVNGSGNDNQPKGLLNYSGFTSHTGVSGQYTVKQAVQMRTDLEEADFDLEQGAFGYLMRSIVREGMILERTTQYSAQTTGKGYVFAPPAITPATLEERVGAKIAITTHVPIVGAGATGATSTVIHGDFSHFILAIWAGMMLDVSTEASNSAGENAWLKNQVWIKAEQDYDCCVDLPAAFVSDSTVYAFRGDFTDY